MVQWPALLGYKGSVTSFREMAIDNAEKEARPAQYAAALKWVSWIWEGPAGGFRRQHRFSRNVDGWTATQKSTGNITDVDQQDELDELEGLSAEDLNHLKYHQGKAGTPATAQQGADD